ncbi:MAG: hypothetical protein QM760_17310 [Nibricoccus sp.]
MRTDDLAWAVRALAQPAKIQRTLFPSFAATADELALIFEEHYQPAIARQGNTWTEIQALTLQLLDQQLTEMSGPKKEEIWVKDDCLDHADWSVVRRLANEAISAFGWPAEAPPPSDAIYIPTS